MFEIFQHCYTNTLNYLNETFGGSIQSTALTCILCYAKTITYIQEYFSPKNNSCMKPVYQYFTAIETFFTGRLVEPDCNWICIYNVTSDLEKSYSIEYFLNEEYKDIELIQTFNYYKYYYKNITQTDETIKETLIMMKHNIGNIYRFITNTHSISSLKNIYITKEHFISAEYSDSIQTTPINIDLSKVYFSGNEILSPSFILQYLKYSKNYVPKDLEYNIKIIDMHLNIFDINKNKYILILEDGYQVLDI